MLTRWDLRTRRHAIGLSQVRLAQMAGLSPILICNFEYGRRRKLQPDEARRIEAVLATLENASDAAEATVARIIAEARATATAGSGAAA